MVQYYGNGNFAENNDRLGNFDKWLFKELHPIFLSVSSLYYLSQFCVIRYSPTDQLWEQLAKCVFLYHIYGLR